MWFWMFEQEHPGLRGTPLAMLAAQCSKLSSKSPPPLADAAVGKGFHPWKKSSASAASTGSSTTTSSTSTTTSGNNTLATSSSSNSINNNNTQSFNGVSQNGQQRQTATTTSTSASSVTSLGAGLGMGYPHHQRAGMGATAATSYGGDLYFSHPQAPDMYSRTAHHPYEQAWQFQQHVKQEAATVNGSSWWDMHQAAAAGGWLDMSGATAMPPHHTSAMHAAAAAAAASAAYSSDYSASLAAAGSTAHLLSTGQHLLQDTYKSMQQHHSSVTAPFGVGLGTTGHQATAASVSSAATSAHQVRPPLW